MSGVLVVVEQRNGSLTRLSLEALAAGQRLATQLAMTVRRWFWGKGFRRSSAN